MNTQFYKTDLGIVAKDSTIRIKTSYVKKEISESEFLCANPVRITKQDYLMEMNYYFRNTPHEWEYNGEVFCRGANFSRDFKIDKLPKHDINKIFGHCYLVMYRNRIYYTFISANYYPQMQLVDFHTKELLGKWTNVRNLAPVINKKTGKYL